MSTRFKAFLAAATVLALPVLGWATEVATSCGCPFCR
jgi:hypothetical protein